MTCRTTPTQNHLLAALPPDAQAKVIGTVYAHYDVDGDRRITLANYRQVQTAMLLPGIWAMVPMRLFRCFCSAERMFCRKAAPMVMMAQNSMGDRSGKTCWRQRRCGMTRDAVEAAVLAADQAVRWRIVPDAMGWKRHGRRLRS